MFNLTLAFQLGGIHLLFYQGEVRACKTPSCSCFQKFLCPMRNSRFACCLQGGGVLVSSGTVSITFCSIYGNTVPACSCSEFPIPDGKVADVLALSHLHNCECSGQLQDVRAAETLKSSHHPHGRRRFARCLQGGGVYVSSGTVTISSCTISGNTASYVRAHVQNFPIAPMGKLLMCLP